MKTPADFVPLRDGLNEEGRGEELVWLPIDGETKYFPEFFRTELLSPSRNVKHIVTDERKK